MSKGGTLQSGPKIGKMGGKLPAKTDAEKEEERMARRAPLPDEEELEETNIQTPEQENSLYEQRFTKRNNRLFQKLLKEWTK